MILLLLWVGLCAFALGDQEFPGGELQRRPALVTADKGQHPKVLVQTVPHADVTATCLAIRYRTPGQPGSDASAAHLYEHLLFRSVPGRPAGALLLRTEELGAQMRAQLGPSVLFFSELVPSDKGLESLDLQMARLHSIPEDESGLEIERGSIGLEIRAAKASPEDQARRQLLQRFGLEVAPEGELEPLRAVDRAKLEEFLKGVSLKDDVVLTIIGPHTNRQVRQHLARNLQPLTPRGVGAGTRPKLKAPDKKPITVKSQTSQISHFVAHKGGGPALASTARALLQQSLGTKHQVNVINEDAQVWRIDIAPPPPSGANWLSSATPKLSLEKLQRELRDEWLERWESPLDRAEMMATSELRWGRVVGPPTMAEMPALVAEANSLLKAAQEQGVKLELTSPEGQPRLFPYREVANRGSAPGEVLREELPNGIQVSFQNVESWPIVAISGFFRLKRELTTEQSLTLERELTTRAGGEMEFEVRPGGLFFHTWSQSDDLSSRLARVAEVLKGLAEANLSLSDLPQTGSVSASPMEQFFVQPFQNDDKAASVKTQELLDPNNAHLVVVGSLDEEQLDRGLRPAWSGWFRDKKPTRLFPPKDPGSDDKAEPNKTIPTRSGPPLLLIGFQGPTRANPDFLAFNLALQSIAGRPTTSTLARFLRDRERTVDSLRVFPLTGSADPSASPESQQTWVIALRLSSSEVDTEQVLSVVEQRLKRLAEEGLPEAELRRTRAYLKGRLKLSTATTRGRARVLAHAEFYRLSESYSRDYAGLYDSLKRPQVKAICQKYFAQPKTRWLYLKPATADKTGIETTPAKKEG